MSRPLCHTFAKHHLLFVLNLAVCCCRGFCNIRKMNDMNGMEIYSDMLIDMMLDICIEFDYISKKFHSYIKNRNC